MQRQKPQQELRTPSRIQETSGLKKGGVGLLPMAVCRVALGLDQVSSEYAYAALPVNIRASCALTTSREGEEGRVELRPTSEITMLDWVGAMVGDCVGASFGSNVNQPKCQITHVGIMYDIHPRAWGSDSYEYNGEPDLWV